MNSRTQATVLHARGITGTGGGPEKTIMNSPRFLKEAGYDCICAYMHPPKDPGFDLFCERAHAAGAKIESITDSGPFDFSVVRHYKQLCEQSDVAIWHAHDYKTDAIGLLLKRKKLRSMKLVTTIHGWVQATARTRLYYALDRRLLRFYDHVITVSQDLYDECASYGVPLERLTLVNNAIDEQEFRRSQSRTEARQALSLPVDGLLIGGAGRLAPEKGFDLLLEAAARNFHRGIPVRVAIAGTGECHAQLVEKAKQLGIEDRVHFLGHQQNMIPFYEALDLFALSSLREGLPNVVLESMALETPIVTTNVAGIPTLIDDREHGLVVDIGDIDGLSNAIFELLLDEDLRRTLASKARARIESQYSFRNRMQRVIDIYDHLLTSSSDK